jgi:hypothetical protein
MAHAVETILLLGAAAFLALVVASTVRAVRGYRRLRRRASGLFARVRRGDLPVTDAAWWDMQWQRRRLWRSVTAAERAVASATAAGVPTGDLRHVTRRLRAAANAVDTGLATGARNGDLLRQARDLARAADEVARAAADSVAADAAPQTAGVVELVRLEVAAVREAWRGVALTRVHRH